MPTEVAEAVIERSGGACEARTPKCSRGAGQQLHHRLLRRHGGPHVAENLLHVCSPCHDYIHAHPTESYLNGWLVRSGSAEAHTLLCLGGKQTPNSPTGEEDDQAQGEGGRDL